MKLLTKSSIQLILVTSQVLQACAYAEDLPPSLPRPEGVVQIGTIDGNPVYGPSATPSANNGSVGGPSQREINWYPGMKDSQGTVIPPPLYNPDGTPYVEGVSPRPTIPSAVDPTSVGSYIQKTVEWFPGMKDSQGTLIPPPLFNPDGSAYIEGVSAHPKIPVYANNVLATRLNSPTQITSKVLIKKIDGEIKSTDVALNKSKNNYILNFGGGISAIDSAIYIAAVNKKSRKITKIEIKIDSQGQAVVPANPELSKSDVYIKRGSATLKKVTIGTR
jgi:hypothetical protein